MPLDDFVEIRHAYLPLPDRHHIVRGSSFISSHPASDRSRCRFSASAVAARFFRPVDFIIGPMTLKGPFGVISSSWSTRVLPPRSERVNRCPPRIDLIRGTIRSPWFRSNSRISCRTVPNPRSVHSYLIPFPGSPGVSALDALIVGFHDAKL